MSNNTITIPPLTIPYIREWELDENSTHYDRMVAAPNDDTIRLFFSSWAIVLAITGIATTSLFLALVCSCRGGNNNKNPFNLYLIYLILPDMLLSWFCGFQCLRNVLAKGEFDTVGTFAGGVPMCKLQSFYVITAIGANSWMNFWVAHSLYKMLDAARKFRRFRPPTKKRITCEACAAYLLAAILGCLSLPGNTTSNGNTPVVDWWPHKTQLVIGAACIPTDFDTKSTIFFYTVFFPLLFGIPFGYFLVRAIQIWKSPNLLPPTGKRRILVVYFFRLAAVFLIMWLPGLVCIFIAPVIVESPWVQWTGGTWAHLQGVASCSMALLKDDIWETYKSFWTCQQLCVKDSANDVDNSDNISVGSGWGINMSSAASTSTSVFGLSSNPRRGNTFWMRMINPNNNNNNTNSSKNNLGGKRNTNGSTEPFSEYAEKEEKCRSTQDIVAVIELCLEREQEQEHEHEHEEMEQPSREVVCVDTAAAADAALDKDKEEEEEDGKEAVCLSSSPPVAPGEDQVPYHHEQQQQEPRFAAADAFYDEEAAVTEAVAAASHPSQVEEDHHQTCPKKEPVAAADKEEDAIDSPP